MALHCMYTYISVHKHIQIFLWLLCVTTPAKGTSLGLQSSWFSQKPDSGGPGRLFQEMLWISCCNWPGRTLQTGKEVQVYALGIRKAFLWILGSWSEIRSCVGTRSWRGISAMLFLIQNVQKMEEKIWRLSLLPQLVALSPFCEHLRTKEIPNHFPSLPQDSVSYLWISPFVGIRETGSVSELWKQLLLTFQAAVRHAVLQASFFCPDARLAPDNPSPLVAPLRTAGVASVPFPHCVCWSISATRVQKVASCCKTTFLAWYPAE